MATKAKTGATRIEHQPGKPKRTRQGNGKHSKPNHGRKKMHGQGKG